MLDSKQITVGFKVAALKKKEIAQTAADLGMDVSTYLREGILGEHEKVARLSHVPDELVFDTEDIETALKVVQYLKGKHPKQSASKIILAALKLSAENETLFVSNKIKNHF